MSHSKNAKHENAGSLRFNCACHRISELFVGIYFSDDRYATLLWEECPDLIHYQGGDVAYIEMLTNGSYGPVRPRTKQLNR